MNPTITAIADWMGITERRQSEQEWRIAAAEAQPGEIWTATVIMRDNRHRRSMSWTSGPVSVLTSRRRQIRMLGEQALPDRVRPLGPAAGLFPPKTRFVLQRGDEHMPPRLPSAGGAALEAVETGVNVVVEYRDRSHPDLRCVESGHTGWVRHHNGRIGRHIGDTWIDLDSVTGLIVNYSADLEQLHHTGPRPDLGQQVIIAETGLSVDGAR